MSKFTKLLILILLSLSLGACGESGKTGEADAAAKDVDPMSDTGVGPVSSVKLGDLDAGMAAEGEKIFGEKCSSCHKIEKRYIGPALAGVTERRSPEWIMNMILNPEQMVAENEAAKQLLMEYSAPMANQSLTEDEARKLLEYFRKIDLKK